MKQILKPIAMCLIAAVLSMQVKAQDSDASSKSQDIIIHKKGASKEKLDIVVDGDNITVNGKPVDEFKSKDIDIIKQDMDFAPDISINAPDAPNPPDVMAFGPSGPQVHAFRNDMMRNVKTNKAFLGVMSAPVKEGSKITEVTKESAAEKAGLKEGDVITKVDKETIAGPDDLYKSVGAHKPGDKVTVTYLSNGKQTTAQVILGKSESVRVYSWNTPSTDDLNFKNFSPRNFSFSWDDNKPRMGIEAQDTEDGNGVKVTGLNDEDAPAAKAGLKEDDIITQVNGNKISSVDDLKASIKDIKKGDTVKITYKRNNQTQTVDVKIPKDLKTIDL